MTLLSSVSFWVLSFFLLAPGMGPSSTAEVTFVWSVMISL